MVDMERVKEYAKKALHRRALDKESIKLGKELEEMQRELLEQFSQDSVQNVKLDGLATVFIRSQLWAGAWQDDEGIADKQLTCDALKEAGLGVFVSEGFNTNTVSSWLREQSTDELGDPILPPELVDKLRVTRDFKLVVLKA